MSEIVKQEGDFKISKPRKPKSLTQDDKVAKVDLEHQLMRPTVR